LAEDDQMKHWVVIDCRKTRNARDEWLKTNSQVKKLGSPPQRSRLFGTERGLEADYGRVTRRSLITFANVIKCPCQDFEAGISTIEYKRWLKQWNAKREALKREKVIAIPSRHREIEALHQQLRGYYELYHHATAKASGSAISVSLIHIDGLDVERSAVRCALHDSNKSRSYLRLNGFITPKLGFLYWELAGDGSYNRRRPARR
jgi:hypothetical protein